MAYIPKNQYQNLYTNGNEYKLLNAASPQSYIGPYLKLTNGKLYAGDTPNTIIGELKPLVSPKPRNIVNHKNNLLYSALQPELTARQGQYIPIPSHTPQPSPLDYANGFLKRYVVVKRNTHDYIEISKDTYDNFTKGKYDIDIYEPFSLEWALGDNNEFRNNETLRRLEYRYKGVSNFFPHKTQFGVKQGVVNLNPSTRIYPSGEIIPKSLPAAYQIGNKEINTIDNPRVPSFQYCGNCIFNQNNYCTRWEANIKNNYWCVVWQGLGSQE